jgi:hypothetical protein
MIRLPIPDQKHFRLHIELSLDVTLGNVMGNNKPTITPQPDNGYLIFCLIGSDFYRHNFYNGSMPKHFSWFLPFDFASYRALSAFLINLP